MSAPQVFTINCLKLYVINYSEYFHCLQAFMYVTDDYLNLCHFFLHTVSIQYRNISIAILHR